LIVQLNEVSMETLLLGKDISEWIWEKNDFENVWFVEESWSSWEQMKKLKFNFDFLKVICENSEQDCLKEKILIK
jgi:hypothetical protein